MPKTSAIVYRLCPWLMATWRRARAAEWDSLLMSCPLTGTGGSNPLASAAGEGGAGDRSPAPPSSIRFFVSPFCGTRPMPCIVFRCCREAIAWHAPVAQRIEHLTTDQKVRGSNPFGRTIGKVAPPSKTGGGRFLLGGGGAPRAGHSPVAHRIANLTPDTTVWGSNPCGRTVGKVAPPRTGWRDFFVCGSGLAPGAGRPPAESVLGRVRGDVQRPEPLCRGAPVEGEHDLVRAGLQLQLIQSAAHIVPVADGAHPHHRGDLATLR